jgi:MFS family permease
MFATSTVFGALFVLIEASASHPIIDLRMLRDKAFSAANVTILMFGLGFFGALFLVVQYLTVVEGYSTLEAAFALTPFPVCILLTGPMAGRLTDKLGPRSIAVAGVLVFGAALLMLSRLDGDVPYPQIAWRLGIAGIGAGLTFAPLTTAAMGSVPGGRAGVGAGVFNTARQVGFTIGLAILVAVFVGALPSRLTEAQADAAVLIEQSDLPEPAKEGIIQGLLSAPAEEASQAARSGRAQEFDLYDQLKETAGADIADSLRPTLDLLSQDLRSVFAKATASAFSRSFVVAAIILWTGLLPALLVPRRVAGPGPPQDRRAAATG